MQYPMFEEHSDLERVINVSKVQHRSPFRYPGGKTWLVPRIKQWLLHKRNVPLFIEPFCGGAIIGLTVAFENLARQVVLIEKDPKVAAVWEVMLNGSDADIRWLNKRILDFHINRENVQSELSSIPENTREQAFITILKNRVQHGGCLAQGTGLIKEGENGKGIGSRWYPETIVRRINDIHAIRQRISFYCADGIDFIRKESGNNEAVFFIDPPYWIAGTRLYDYSELNHKELFRTAKDIKGDFLMTYDDVEEVHKYAREFDFQTRLISMQNKNHAKKRELLISKKFDWL